MNTWKIMKTLDWAGSLRTLGLFSVAYLLASFALNHFSLSAFVLVAAAWCFGAVLGAAVVGWWIARKPCVEHHVLIKYNPKLCALGTKGCWVH